MFSINCVAFGVFIPNVKITFHGRESLSHLRPKIWDLIFKDKIKNWKLQNYLCRLCKDMFKILVLFDTFSKTLGKGLLPNFLTFVRLIGANRLVHEITKKSDHRNQIFYFLTLYLGIDYTQLIIYVGFLDICIAQAISCCFTKELTSVF